MEPLDRSTIWPYDEQGEPTAFFYQRYAHPTGTELLQAGPVQLLGGVLVAPACGNPPLGG